MKLIVYTVGGVIVGFLLGSLLVWILPGLGMAKMMSMAIGAAVWCLVSIIGLGLGCIIQAK